MAEYITIMVINNKTAGAYWAPFFHICTHVFSAQITAELEDCKLTLFYLFLRYRLINRVINSNWFRVW